MKLKQSPLDATSALDAVTSTLDVAILPLGVVILMCTCAAIAVLV